MCEQGLYDRRWHPYVRMYIYVCDPLKFLNDILGVDQPFQTLTIVVLSNLQTSSTTACSTSRIVAEISECGEL